MNLIDKTLAVFDPSSALRREIARQKLTAFSRYDAARITRDRPQARVNMPAEQIGGTTERIRLMNRARDLDDNFATTRAILTHFIVHVAGDLSYQARTGNADLDRQVETYFRKWMCCCDITGRHDFLSLVQLVLRSVIVDGDCGVIVARDAENLRLQTITADRIGRDNDIGNVPTYVGGITLNQLGVPVSYRIYTRSNTGAYQDFVEQPSEFFCHVFNATRLDEYRGRSVMATMLNDAADISDLVEYEKLAARWSSSQAGVITTEFGADEEMASMLRGGTDNFGNDIKLTALEPGRVNYLNAGESMEAFKAGDRPAPAFREFVQYLENRMCRSLGVSARVILDRPSMGPEARKDLMQAERTFDFWRRLLEGQFLNKVRRMVLLNGIAHGDLPDSENIMHGEWQWPGSVSIDAGRDARADIELWRAGLTTASEIYGENGRDWESSLQQRAKESAYIKKLAEENGVSPEEISTGQASVATDPMLAPDPAAKVAPAEEEAIASPELPSEVEPDEIQGSALNGAQISSLMGLATSVAEGLLPISSAKAIAQASFPLIPESIIDRIFADIVSSAPDETANVEGMSFAIPAKYAHINFRPTAIVAMAAARGMKWAEEGGVKVDGIKRARDLIARKNLSSEAVRRMASYFSRHEAETITEGFNLGEKTFPSLARISWQLRGGTAGRTWASVLIRQMGESDDAIGLSEKQND